MLDAFRQRGLAVTSEMRPKGQALGPAAERGHGPAGHLLAIRERSDETSEPCPPWTNDARSRGRFEVRETLLDTGLRHGFLYRPLPEWVDPVVEWATRR